MLIKCKPDPNFHIGITNSTSKDILPALSSSKRTHFHIIVQMLTHIFVKANLKRSFIIYGVLHGYANLNVSLCSQNDTFDSLSDFPPPMRAANKSFLSPSTSKRPDTFSALTIQSSLEHGCKIYFEKKNLISKLPSYTSV